MPFCWFCHGAAHFSSLICDVKFYFREHMDKTLFLGRLRPSKRLMHRSFASSAAPLGLGIVGTQCSLSAMFWPQHCPTVLWNCWAFVPCPTSPHLGNFTFIYQDLSWAFGRALTIKMSPQCWVYTQTLQRESSIAPLFLGPYGAPGLQITCIWPTETILKCEWLVSP